MTASSDLLVKDAAAMTRTLPLYGSAFSYVVPSIAASALLNAKDFLFIKGSATKVVRLKRIRFGLLSDGVHAGSLGLVLVRTSTAPTTSGGAVTAVTPAGFDPTVDGAPTAVVNTITPTVTNGVGTEIIAAGGAYVSYVAGPTDTGASGNQIGFSDFDFTQHGDQAPTLRGVNDFFCLESIGGAPTGSSAIVWVQTEESDT